MNKQQLNEVVHYLKSLHEYYNEFEALTDELSKHAYSEPEFEACVQKIQFKTSQIRELESERGGALATYIKSPSQKHPLVKPLVESLMGRIQTLVKKYGEFEDQARESRSKLLPVVNEGVRMVKMKSAYARNST